MLTARRKAERKRREVLCAEMDRVADERAPWTADVEADREELLEEAVREVVRSALTPKQRLVVEGYFFEGLSQGDLARQLGITQLSIQKFGEIREYLHFHVADSFPIELTVYPLRELRFRPRSSTDGKPIVRVTAAALELLMAREHAEAYAQYVADGTIAGLEEALRDRDADEGDEPRPAPGPFDGLLLDGPDEEGLRMALLAAEDDGDFEETYDPLPGFEHFH